MQIKGIYICDGKACTLCKTDTTGCIRTYNENHAINKSSVELMHLIKDKFNIILDSTNEILYFREKGEFDE